MKSPPPPALAEETAQALRAGGPGLAVFRDRFEACSDLFEQGRDADARRELREVLPPLLDFVGFCAAILDHSRRHLPETTCAPLAELNLQLESALAAMLAASEAGDAVCAADVLRLDLCEVMTAYEPRFDELARQWQQTLPA